MGEIISLFQDQELTPQLKAHLIQRIADLSIEVALLESERNRLESRLRDE